MTSILRRFRRWIGRRGLSPRDLEARAWIAGGNDRTLRLQYDLTSDSVVFDLGGYEGQWASDIFAMYQCVVHVFEPVPAYASDIAERFRLNDRIHLHPLGLAGRTQEATISVEADRSSMFDTGNDEPEGAVVVSLVRASDFLDEHGFDDVELLKINIEGAEYDLLDHLLDEGLISRFRDIQIQFHDFVPNADRRMRTIRDRLVDTHEPTYQVDFVWENWRRR